ncbi:hypothetical protein [Methyloversatilis sp. NSM2]|uniref:hypothetical protein n=1 Tax=Methyloversatilis sp. NSM2 TaxID=3134135 RepID=UPI00310E1A9A
MTLTESQMHDLAGRLTRLRAIDAEICTQIDELIGARIRLQDARNRYHALHQVITGNYGRENAPAPDLAIHGPRPGRPSTRPAVTVLDPYEQTDASARHTDPTSQER